MKIQESAENYLETILVISKRKPQVRSIDIANELSFSKPSVSVAMKNLRLNGYINVNQEGYITLTESGLAIAEKIYERHELLSTWLIKLGVAPETASEDACRMEHVISTESFLAIKQHTKNMAEKYKKRTTAINNFIDSCCSLYLNNSSQIFSTRQVIFPYPFALPL